MSSNCWSRGFVIVAMLVSVWFGCRNSDVAGEDTNDAAAVADQQTEDDAASDPRDEDSSDTGATADVPSNPETAATVCLGPRDENTFEACSDGCSNDDDQFVDCDDFDCCGVRTCPVGTSCAQTGDGGEATYEACSDGSDNDGDGHTDEQDYGCCQLVDGSYCPVSCDSRPVSLTVVGADEAGATEDLVFSDAIPGMWQVGVASGALQYSDVSFRGRSREVGLRLSLPTLTSSGITARFRFTVTSTSPAHWSVIAVDMAFSGPCGVGAAAFSSGSSSSTNSATLELNQPGFPFPNLWQSGSEVVLLVHQSADSPDSLPDQATMQIRYLH